VTLTVLEHCEGGQLTLVSDQVLETTWKNLCMLSRWITPIHMDGITRNPIALLFPL